MNNNLTHIAFILDRSGSMDSMAKEAIGGFNAFIAKLIKQQRAVYRLSRVERSSLRGEFLFLGADVESVEYAKTLNVESAYAQQFDNSGEGVQEAMSYSSEHISKRRRGNKHTAISFRTASAFPISAFRVSAFPRTSPKGLVLKLHLTTNWS